MARTRLYRNGVLIAENFPAEDISDHLPESDTAVWLDMSFPTAADLATISEELDLHALAVEDAVGEHQRAKLDRYDTHSFLTAYAVRLDNESGTLETSELAAFVTERALVTVRKDEHFDIEAVVARWDSAADLAKNGVGFLLHGLLDYVVDGQFEVVRALDEEIESLEDQVLAEEVDHKQVQLRSLHLRRSLVTLRRVVLPMREVMNAVMRPDFRLVTDELMPYYEDVRDHVLRTAEWTDSLRDLVTTVRETQLNLQSNRLNMIMKKVTGWAAIIAVPTAITGFYGQNVPYPGNGQPWGFWMSTAIMLFLSGGLFVLFRRRDWL